MSSLHSNMGHCSLHLIEERYVNSINDMNQNSIESYNRFVVPSML